MTLYDIFQTTLKSTILATVLFLGFLAYQGATLGLAIILIAFFILSIISFFMFLFTVFPFSLLQSKHELSLVFLKYFHTYAIISLLFYTSLGFYFGFYVDQIIILAIAYLTGLQSWVWSYSPKKNSSNAK